MQPDATIEAELLDGALRERARTKPQAMAEADGPFSDYLRRRASP